MKLLLITFFVGVSTAAKLSNNYLPPHSAGSAGGHGGFLQGPSSPSNQYIPPKTSFNQQGQPVQWSHGGWNAGGQQGGGSGASWQGQTGGSRFGGSGGGYNPGSAQGGGFGGGAGHQQPQRPQVPILKFENENDGNGNYHFDYQTGDGTSHQQQGHVNNAGTDWAENVVSGQYSYTGDDGKQYTVSYKADGNGFQAVGDHLPTPPPQPAEIQEVWNKVLSQQAASGGAWQQGGGDDSGAWQQGGGGGGGGAGGAQSWQGAQGGHGGQGSWQQGGGGGGTSWQQQQSHGQGGGAHQPARPFKPPQNQYLPPSSSGGYHY